LIDVIWTKVVNMNCIGMHTLRMTLLLANCYRKRNKNF